MATIFLFFRLDNKRHRAINSLPGEGLGKLLDQIGAIFYIRVYVGFNSIPVM